MFMIIIVLAWLLVPIWATSVESILLFVLSSTPIDWLLIIRSTSSCLTRVSGVIPTVAITIIISVYIWVTILLPLFKFINEIKDLVNIYLSSVFTIEYFKDLLILMYIKVEFVGCLLLLILFCLTLLTSTLRVSTWSFILKATTYFEWTTQHLFIFNIKSFIAFAACGCPTLQAQACLIIILGFLLMVFIYSRLIFFHNFIRFILMQSYSNGN